MQKTTSEPAPRWLFAALILLIWGVAAGAVRTAHADAGARSFTILAVNDVYRIDGLYDGEVGGLARLRSLRQALEDEDPNLLLLHAGDFTAPSFLSRMYRGAQMIDVLNLMDGDVAEFDDRMFITFGNHEFDRGKLKDAGNLDTLVQDSQFTWLGSNIRFASGVDGRPLVGGENLVDSLLVEIGGVAVGLFSLTIDSSAPAYVVDIADPVDRAQKLTALLREQGAAFVVALTHLPLETDKSILETLGKDGPDLIVGGHEHSRQHWPPEQPRIFKADADARSATVIQVALPLAAAPVIGYRYQDLEGQDPKPDPLVQARVQDWTLRHGTAFCAAQSPPEPADCLDRQLGRAAVTLIAEEVAIRSTETNFGNWLADQGLAAFRDAGAQVAFINSGSLRLNQNIPAGQSIARASIEQLFEFPTALRLIEIDGKTLKAVVAKSIEDWPGNGRWLQVAGLAFRHDPETGEVSDFTRLTDAGPRPLADEETIRAVTGIYLLDPAIGDQDGYDMLGLDDIVPGVPQDRTLRAQVILGLRAAGELGIDPEIEGRICQPEASVPCLAIQGP